MLTDMLYDSHEIYVWNDVLEQFSDWLDTLDELREKRGGVNAILSMPEIQALSMIASRIQDLLKGNTLVPILPSFSLSQPLITDLAFMVNSWCGQPLNEQVSNDECNCLNDIYGKLSYLLDTKR